MSQELYFEDLKIGQKFRSESYKLTREHIINFAKQFDPQVFHTDPEKAKDTFFNGLVASGWNTASVSMRLLVETFKVAGGLIGAQCDVKWPIPTSENDTLHVEIEIIQISESKTKKDRGHITIKVHTVNQNNQIAQILISKIVVLKKQFVV